MRLDRGSQIGAVLTHHRVHQIYRVQGRSFRRQGIGNGITSNMFQGGFAFLDIFFTLLGTVLVILVQVCGDPLVPKLILGHSINDVVCHIPQVGGWTRRLPGPAGEVRLDLSDDRETITIQDGGLSAICQCLCSSTKFGSIARLDSSMKRSTNVARGWLFGIT